VKPEGGIAAFFSCGPKQFSYESKELKYGIFFHYLIQEFSGRRQSRPVLGPRRRSSMVSAALLPTTHGSRWDRTPAGIWGKGWTTDEQARHRRSTLPLSKPAGLGFGCSRGGA
jgi:hypothetical protein